MKLLKITTFCLLLIWAFSCKNDDDNSLSNNNSNSSPEVFTENFGSEINRDFLGEVVDQNNNPIQNTTITIGNQTTLTDANGVFIIKDANIYEHFGYVKVVKAGYINGSRSVVPTTGTNKVKIMLLEEIVVGTTASGISETISLSNGASVALEGDFIKEDGTAYSGAVNVIIHHLDPTDENMSDQMPGMLYAANAQNEERMLHTFGMLAVELRGSNGEDLNLANGTSAEITVPLDASLIATAPATIPLWYFDEVAGYWREEGQATLVGNAYVGAVSHFSFWNCDIPAKAVELHLNVTDEYGNALSNVLVNIISANYGTRSGFTNIDGQVYGLVPSNEILQFTMEYNYCGSTFFYEGNKGPFSTDSEIDIAATSSISDTLTGNFISCEGNPVNNGFIRLIIEDQMFYEVIDEGQFNISVVFCDDIDFFTIEAVDLDSFQSSGLVTYYNEDISNNLGTIIACEDRVEYIEYIVDDTYTQTFNSPLYVEFLEDYLSNGSYFKIQSQTDNCFFMEALLPPNPPFIGLYNNSSLPYQFAVSECFDISENNNDINYHLVALGEIGEYVDINFNGSYEDTQGDPHTITGVIHVIRDF